MDTTDDLSGVLDDAELVDGPNAGNGLSVNRNGDVLEITGTVPAGQTRTVTYTVEVKPYAEQGNHVLRNALACQPGEPQPCAPETTRHPVRRLVVTKSSDATADTRQGDTVTYTVTAHNVGDGGYTDAEPAVLVDDLTGVLDDATFNDDATADLGDDPSYDPPRVRWEGALAADETVTITYTVTLGSGGDGIVRNVAWAPKPGDPPGPTPDCDDPATTVPCDDTESDLPRLSIRKTSNRTDLPADGEHLVFTVTVRNEGPGDYTAAAPATFNDDLSAVLDDATFDIGSINSSTGTATFDAGTGTLTWSGVLAAGASATVTYSVTYDEDLGGDQQLNNAACVPEEQASDEALRCITVRVPGSGLVVAKSSDPADGTAVDAADEITYTLTFVNTGPADAVFDTTDDLSGVLDDAELIDGPNAGPGLTATRTGDHIDISGTVPTGESRKVTYTVRVLAADARGDSVLRNALACPSADGPDCEPETTEHPVRDLASPSPPTAPPTPGRATS